MTTFRKLDARAMNMATYIAKKRVSDTLKRAQQITEDTDRARRIPRQFCIACHYFPAIAGQAFTHRPCEACAALQTYSSTSTDALCLPCAQQHGLCKHCGGNIDIYAARENWPDFKPTA